MYDNTSGVPSAASGIGGGPDCTKTPKMYMLYADKYMLFTTKHPASCSATYVPLVYCVSALGTLSSANRNSTEAPDAFRNAQLSNTTIQK